MTMGGKKTGWAKSAAKASGFGTPQGGPLARPSSWGDGKSNGNYGRHGQIIPPNRGQFPRGTSLPGFKPAMGQFGKMMRAARAAMMMKGLLGPLDAAMAIGDFAYDYALMGDEYATFDIGQGWTQVYDCVQGRVGWYVRPGLDGVTCGGGLNAPNATSWSNIAGTAGPSPQAIADGTTITTVWWRADTTLGNTARRQKFTRPVGQHLPFIAPGIRGAPRVDPLPAAYRPPLPQASEKTYGRPASRALPWGQTSPAMEYGPPYRGPKPVTHPNLPPKPGDKEKKERMNYGAPGKIYGAFTEAGDAAGCYIEAKGGKAGGGTRAKLDKAWALANDPNAPAFDGAVFAACMILANAQDAAIGKLSGGAAKARNNSPYAPKRPGGYQGGGWSTRMH